MTKIINKIITIALLILTSFVFINGTSYAAVATNEGIATASEVLVVYNSSYSTDSDSDGTQDSLEIANYYKNKRSIPEVNVVGLAMPTTEVITRSDYDTYINFPLRVYLTDNNLDDSIKYIVLVKGVPLKISATNGINYFVTNYSSVDAAVCLLYQTYNTSWLLDNPFYNVDPTFTKSYRFKTDHFVDDGVTLKYLVTRIDGYSVADMEGMIDRGYSADTSGNGYWVIDDHQKGYDTMSLANTAMSGYGFNVTPSPYTDTTDIITSAGGSVMGYTSHGIHAGMIDGYYSSTLGGFTYSNGAVTSTYESFNAYGFVSASQSSHGQLAEFIAEGGSGGVGNVYEPWALTIAQEKIWMPAYALGYTWADAAYMSLRYMDFATVVLGDPLMIISDIDPPSSVSNMDDTPGDGQVSLSWTDPVDADYVGTKILRKTGDFSSGITDGTLVYDGSDSSYTDTGLTNNTTYYYSAFAYDTYLNYSSLSSGSKASSTPVGNSSAPSEVTNLTAIPGNQQVILSFTNPTDSDYTGTKILRKTGSYPTNETDGTLIYNDSGTSYIDTSVTNDTTYYYAAFAYDDANNYSTLGSTSKTTAVPFEILFSSSEPDIISTGSVTGVSVTSGDEQIELSWTNPSDDGFVGVIIVRREDYYSSSPRGGKIIYRGSSTSHIDKEVLNGKTYFYSIFAYDSVPNYSLVAANSQALGTPCSGVCSDSTPSTTPTFSSIEPDNTQPDTITNFTATGGTSKVTLSWENPFDDSQWKGTLIVRKTGNYSNSHTDGTPVYRGTNNSYTDTSVSSGTTYYYSAFSFDDIPNYIDASANSRDNATPN